MPKFNATAFEKKLPGTITQNCSFLQYLPLLLIEELESSNFLESPFWKMFIHLKRFTEIVQASTRKLIQSKWEVKVKRAMEKSK